MKKLFSAALVPAVLATLPLLAISAPQVEGQMGAPHTGTHMTGKTGMGAGVNLTATQQAEVRENFGKGFWSLVEKQYDEAIGSFNRAIAINPMDARVLNGIAWAQYYKGDYSKALDVVNRAIAADPVNAKPHFTKARILDALKRESEALDSYLTFVAVDPMDTNAPMAITRANELLTKWEPQLSEAQKAYFNGLRYLGIGLTDEAIQNLKQFRALEPENPTANLLLGLAYQQAGQPRMAITEFQTVTKVQPQDPVAYYHLGSTYDMAGERQQAQEAFRNFVRFAPNSEEVGVINRRIQSQPSMPVTR